MAVYSVPKKKSMCKSLYSNKEKEVNYCIEKTVCAIAKYLILFHSMIHVRNLQGDNSYSI